MYDDRVDGVRVPHPLTVLDRIEQDNACEQESQLQEGGTPWAEVLAAYIDVLTELIVSHHEEQAKTRPKVRIDDEGL
ncbi:hypothetical protein OG535_06900 [Kitasatospora sp. NBC_00085]|uniref:DUF6269 family protein n=1 Tax=unclassified Kitasatospora TaxID=2633591 RepID=UPI00324C8E33